MIDKKTVLCFNNSSFKRIKKGYDMVDAPKAVEIYGSPLSLSGYRDASTKCLGQVLSDKTLREAAAWAGVVTLKDGRVADVGVFARVRGQADTIPPRRRLPTKGNATQRQQ